MAAAVTISPLFIRDIIDKIGTNDSFFPTEIPDCTLPGPSTPDSIALEESLRRLVARFQDLEQKCSSQSNLIDDRPVSKQLQNVKSGEAKHVCLSCGHRLDVSLTPDESPPIDTSTPGLNNFCRMC